MRDLSGTVLNTPKAVQLGGSIEKIHVLSGPVEIRNSKASLEVGCVTHTLRSGVCSKCDGCECYSCCTLETEV